uniref:Transposase n=1 Tax=Anaerolinea thermolimosa TaxID=229919 RepID=A0A7C4PP19_9CHLR
MDNSVSKQTKKELIQVLGMRYRKSQKQEKTQILDEFIALSGCHRKHAIRLLSGHSGSDVPSRFEVPPRRKIYSEAVKEALIMAWEASDRICGKRLKALLPSLLDAMERHGHLHLAPEVKTLLFKVSPATIDRLLSPLRDPSQARRKTRRVKKVSQQIPIRTYADWNDPVPGYLEIDFVVHGGGQIAGSLIHTLVATDICSGWTDFIPLLAREQSLVTEGLGVIFKQIPFPALGIDSDNDSAFINDTLSAFCKDHQIEFTRSRAYHKNDQAWVEQKNGAVIRRLTGHGRYTGVVACQALAHLYQAARFYVNFFQPSFKLHHKTRDGSKVKRTYQPPATPCDRLLKHPAVPGTVKDQLRLQRQQLDPVKLLHGIRQGQSALAALASPDLIIEGPGRDTLEHFLSQLPRLWQDGEVRPTHRRHSSEPRTWRTHEDAFEGVWCEVLGWLQKEPDATAKSLLERLEEHYPERFDRRQLRTFQRRVKEWRHIMARELVYAGITQ